MCVCVCVCDDRLLTPLPTHSNRLLKKSQPVDMAHIRRKLD